MERADWKRARREKMADTALEVFTEKGIEATTLEEVAERAGVGIASVYRHFGTKADLAVAAAERLWRGEWDAFGDEPGSPTEIEAPAPGLFRAKGLLNRFIKAFDDHRQVFSFLEDFDRFVVREGLDAERLAGYDSMLLEFRQVLKDTLAAGQADGSIRIDLDPDLFCATISQTLVSLAEKLVNRPMVVPSDAHLSGRRELELLVEWALAWLVPTKGPAGEA